MFGQHHEFKDTEAEWGLSRVEYANRDKIRRRRNEALRRQRISADIRAVKVLAPDIKATVRKFETKRGPAYRVQRFNQEITLPFVSILEKKLERA